MTDDTNKYRKALRNLDQSIDEVFSEDLDSLKDDLRSLGHDPKALVNMGMARIAKIQAKHQRSVASAFLTKFRKRVEQSTLETGISIESALGKLEGAFIGQRGIVSAGATFRNASELDDEDIIQLAKDLDLFEEFEELKTMLEGSQGRDES